MLNKIVANIPIGNLRCTGPLCLEGKAANEAPDVFDTLISTFVGAMTMIASVWFLFHIITGAYIYISAGGDKGAIEKGRLQIIHGLLGLTIVFASIFILDLVGELFGLPFITKPAEFIRNIAP